MAEYSKPTDLNKQWGATGTSLTPSDAKITQGNVAEKPLHEYFNWWMYRNDLFNAFMNQHGYPTWDASTEYIAEKSYVMHSNGTIYRCIQTHTNQAIPNATYWEVAFGDYGYSYSKAESDNLYLTKSANLSDLSNTNTARTTLSVYSIAQVDALTAQATETVRGTAEVATAAEARAFSSDTVMITPSKLSEAFKGSNQSLLSNGYQKLPGGLIIQWGLANSVSPSQNVLMNVTFPNACLIAQATDVEEVPSSVKIVSVSTFTTSSITITSNGLASTVAWIAIGY